MSKEEAIMSEVDAKIQSIKAKILQLQQKLNGLKRENALLRQQLTDYQQPDGHMGQRDGLRIKIEEIRGEVCEVINLIEREW